MARARVIDFDALRNAIDDFKTGLLEFVENGGDLNKLVKNSEMVLNRLTGEEMEIRIVVQHEKNPQLEFAIVKGAVYRQSKRGKTHLFLLTGHRGRAFCGVSIVDTSLVLSPNTADICSDCALAVNDLDDI